MNPCGKLALGLFLLGSVVGCSRKPVSSFPQTGLGLSEWGGPASRYGTMSARYGVWGTGMAFVLWTDLRSGAGGSTTGDNAVVYYGQFFTPGQRSIGYRCVTADGKAGKVTIDGKDYLLANGSVFIVSTRGDQIQVDQIKHDTLGLESGQNGLDALVREEPAFEAFFARAKAK